jgi:hypothetical protein
MATSTIQIVPPNQRRWETVLVVAALIAMVLTTGGYVRTYGLEEKPQEILDWQISAFSGLQGVDQAIYNELIVAADEVNWLVYYNGYWPDDADFQDSLLAPFYRDLSWEHNGSVKWTLKNVIQEGEAQGLTLYHGGGGTIETQGAYLLVIDHKHAGSSQITASNIWWHADRNAPVPDTSKVASLILHGWKQVIPYQGIDELERLNAE